LGNSTSWLLVFHLFGVIFWIGSLLLIASLLGMVSDEVGVAKERFIMVASTLFFGGCNIGGTVAIVFGILLMVMEPAVLQQGWLHAKLLLVFILLIVHVRLYQRIVALSDNPSSVSRREFRVIHGIVSMLLLGILALAVIKPF
jgi:protoporphyrinogen IX oxidase